VAVERDQEARDLARSAMARIDKHEAVCVERYGTIVKNQEDGALERKTMHEANQTSIRRIYGLLWKCALGIIAFQAVILAGILFHN
jgi:hypothetical protein